MTIAIDVGRSSIKAATENTQQQFSNVMATSKSRLSALETNLSLAKDIMSMTLLSTVSGSTLPTPQAYLFGDTALKTGATPIELTESKEFHKAAVAEILFCIAHALHNIEDMKPENVTVCINLTLQNAHFKEFYSSHLKGTHSVYLESLIANQQVDFTITDLFCFQQGYTSVFNFLSGVYVGSGTFTMSNDARIDPSNEVFLPFLTEELCQRINSADGKQLHHRQRWQIDEQIGRVESSGAHCAFA